MGILLAGRFILSSGKAGIFVNLAANPLGRDSFWYGLGRGGGASGGADFGEFARSEL